jgi:hypothetical protein
MKPHAAQQAACRQIGMWTAATGFNRLFIPSNLFLKEFSKQAP